MGFLGDIGNYLTGRPGEQQQRQGLLGMGQTGQADYSRLGGELGGEMDYLRKQARGENSLSAEQLRQALQQNVSAQQSMAAGASPQNQAMAALQASKNAMTLGSGLAGQQAMAGIAERNQAQNALVEALLRQRQQAQGNAQFGYGSATPGQSWLDKWAGPIMGGATLAWGGGGKK